MKKKIAEIDDWMRPEYNLSELKLVARGPGRKSAKETVTVELEPDVAMLFPTATDVNEALRLLARVAREAKPRIS